MITINYLVGGIDSGESHIDALIREVLEESGLLVKPDSIKEYGHVLVKEKGNMEDLFIQDNFYYFYDAYQQRKNNKSLTLDRRMAQGEYSEFFFALRGVQKVCIVSKRLIISIKEPNRFDTIPYQAFFFIYRDKKTHN